MLQACNSEKNNLPDLRESYSYKDFRPFGASVAYDIFKKAYPNYAINLSKKNFSDNYVWDYDTASIYFNVSRNFYVSENDADALLEFVYKGNTAFIASGVIDTILLNKMYCKQAEQEIYFYSGLDSLRKTNVKFTKELTNYNETFAYFYYPLSNSFSELNDSYSRVIGYNDADKTNMFVFLWGKGRIYFHAEPKVFSNYFLLTKNNYLYMQQVMQMLPKNPENVYWDNFYGNKNYSSNGKSTSSFSAIMNNPPLKAAFFIALALLLLYIFFNGKRKQRIIPVIKPFENTTIAFAEAIAGLYLSKKDNRVIADKMITYLNEFVRTKYFLALQVSNDGYADLLSRKSGTSLDITQPLVMLIKQINRVTEVSDEQLLQLNGLIEQFLKNKV